MKILALALLLLAGGASAEELADMTSGRYEIKVSGLLCRTCAKAATEEVASLKEVQKASVDFDTETLQLTVKPGQKLTLARLRRALKKASKRVDLGTKLEPVSIKYKV